MVLLCDQRRQPADGSRTNRQKNPAELPEGAWIARSCATGYGEGLITTGLHLDEGVVETMAHYRGAEMVSPGVPPSSISAAKT